MHHRVFLVETPRNMYALTLKGQGKNLTSGQGHVMTEIAHIAYQTMRLDETNTIKPPPTLYLFSIKSYWQNNCL